ncbi:MAG: PPC domain-containing protein [Deltaproteobacteria bacterium]|nr:PPC domain-containing protein [Deltaproteobacteria bacterium]MDQ3298722.1 PPC domain-containing protein [Myxococcota bacterium]
MVRECRRALAIASISRPVSVLLTVLLGGCSLILDFSESAPPPDAALFTQAECDHKEPNNTIDAAAVIDATEVGPAAICPGDDHDFYRFTVPPDTASVTVKITFVTNATGDLDLKLTDAAGSTQGQSRGFENDETVVCPGASPLCPMLPAGDYIFDVFPAQTGYVNRYDIALTIVPL